jgi:hypothetical protein
MPLSKSVCIWGRQGSSLLNTAISRCLFEIELPCACLTHIPQFMLQLVVISRYSFLGYMEFQEVEEKRAYKFFK